MAKLTKSRARKALAEDKLMLSGSGKFIGLTITSEQETPVEGKRLYYRIDLDLDEGVRIAAMVASMKTYDPWGDDLQYVPDNRSTPEKLRALADKLEAEAKGKDSPQ